VISSLGHQTCYAEQSLQIIETNDKSIFSPYGLVREISHGLKQKAVLRTIIIIIIIAT